MNSRARPSWSVWSGVATEWRRIALLRSGRRHGPITRLITPWDLGELTRPFVFLGCIELAPGVRIIVGAQPGTGILTLVLSGALTFESASGNRGIVSAGGFTWTPPGEVVWQSAGHASNEPLRVLQLWVERTVSPASSAAESQCIAPHEEKEEGPVSVVLGHLGATRSAIAGVPSDINYFHVRLKDGQFWRYAAPDGHNVTWLAVERGGVRLRDAYILREQVALFGDSRGLIELQAEGESSFVLGSGRRLDTATSRSRPALGIECANPSLPGNETTVLERRLARDKPR
jgi:redox-sensitive bicupin YhaK (pirin superfamily)